MALIVTDGTTRPPEVRRIVSAGRGDIAAARRPAAYLPDILAALAVPPPECTSEEPSTTGPRV